MQKEELLKILKTGDLAAGLQSQMTAQLLCLRESFGKRRVGKFRHDKERTAAALQQSFLYMVGSGLPKAGQTKGAGAAVGGDDAAAAEPADRGEAALFCGGLGGLADFVLQAHTVDQPQAVAVQIVFLAVVADQLGGDLAHLAAVLLGGGQLTVQDLDTGVQAEDAAAQVSGVADAAAGAEELQIIRQEAHLGSGDDGVGAVRGLLEGHVGVCLQHLGDAHHNGALAHGDLLGVESGDVIPALGGDDGALVRAGGDGGIGQIKDLGVGIVGMELIEHADEILGSAAAGGGELAGAQIIVADLLGREAAVVQGVGAEGNVHGNDLDVILSGQLGRDVGAGLGYKKKGGHGGVLSGKRPARIKMVFKNTFGGILNHIRENVKDKGGNIQYIVCAGRDWNSY